MDNKQFQIELKEAYLRSKQVLNEKQDEYVEGIDCLDHFKRVASLNSVYASDALWGMASKHIASIATMVQDPTLYSLHKWREKLTDLRNYTFLLDALLIDLEVE